MMKKKVSKSTNMATNFGIKLLRSYVIESKIYPNRDVSSLTEEELNNLLLHFYVACRNKKGDFYKISSMRSIRFSLQRYFLDNNAIDIIQNHKFVESTIVFENVLKKIKENGKGEINHHPEMEPEDISKLYQSFDLNDPAGLQEMVWFCIMYFFIRRGRENQRAMTKDTFKVDIDASGKRFIHQVDGESDKNHSISDHTFSTTGEGRIYETGGDKCPVNAFILYLSKLNPNLNALWQRPRPSITIKHDVWYCNIPHGEKYLGVMLSKLSKKYELSQVYTNHSLRVTSLQALDDNNVEGRHIIRVSGHKNVESVENYARKLSASRKRKISTILANSCNRQSESSSSTVSSIQPTTSSPIKHLPFAPIISSTNEATDNDLAQIPSLFLTGSGAHPILYKCSNIHFHYHIDNNKDQKL